MRVRADRGRCIGAGMCALTAPAVFDQDDDAGQVVILTSEPPAELHGAVRAAAGFCPAAAVTVADTETEAEAGVRDAPPSRREGPPEQAPRAR
ncbi:ferredoxin [Streptomyces sp. NPDC002851]